MNLALYRSGRPIRAAKIEIVHPVERSLSISLRRLTIRDSAGQMAQVEMRGSEMPEDPRPGDYYVIDDTGKRVVPKDDFERYYTRIA